MNELALQQPIDSGLRELALFAGAGGGILGGKLLGWRTVCAVEYEPYAAAVLVQRQNDGLLPPFPVWDDVRTFDGRPWRGRVDVVSGGFPCQDISVAGTGAGIEGERSGLWVEMARIVGEVQPRYVLVENSPALTSRGIGRVLGDLAALGYDARWGVLGAVHAGAPHKRERIWILADSESTRLERLGRNARQQEISEPWNDGASNIRNAASKGLPHGTAKPMGQPGTDAQLKRSDRWATEPDVGRVAHGVANRVDRLKAIGNGQVPAVVEIAWKILTNQ